MDLKNSRKFNQFNKKPLKNIYSFFRTINILTIQQFCCSVSHVVSFNGSALIRWDLREPLETERHSMRFRFKTNVADGVMMYSRGTQGDFFALQMRDNRMLLNIDLGSGIVTSMSVGSLLDDNTWHDVVIARNRRDLIFSVDRVLIRGRIKGEFHRLDLNRAVKKYFFRSTNLKLVYFFFLNWGVSNICSKLKICFIYYSI